MGDYTYYSDNKKSPNKFYDNIDHHYEFLGDKTIIGKFYAIAEGVKFIMKRFSDEKIEFLLKLQWWNCYEDKIFNNLEKLTAEVGLDQLMKKYI